MESEESEYSEGQDCTNSCTYYMEDTIRREHVEAYAQQVTEDVAQAKQYGNHSHELFPFLTLLDVDQLRAASSKHEEIFVSVISCTLSCIDGN